MNKERRKMIEGTQSDIQNILGMLEQLIWEIEDIKDMEQEAYDNLPDSIQSSDKGEAIYDSICNLENAYDNITNCVSYLEDCDGDLEEAKGW